MAYKKVVIIGGGFAGLNAAKTLANTGFDVWVIDKTNHHLFQPLLYQVASAALSPADIATPIREILKDYKNITVIMGEIVDIKKSEKVLIFKDHDHISYDYLIVATGAKHSYFGNDQWKEFAPGMKTLVDALSLREKILISFEKAERTDSISEARTLLNFVIIGGGPTGVELAGALAEIAYETMLKNFRRIDTKKAKIYLIEGSDRVLPVYPRSLSEKAKSYLDKFGVQVILNERVTNITEKGVQVGDRFIESNNIIWAAGNTASSLLKTLDIPLDRQGRAIVNKDLTIPDHPEIFVIGDAACATDKKGKPLPGLAPVAVQQGRYVAKILRKNAPVDKRPKFQYLDKGTMATIGKTKAIGMFGKVKYSGFIAWLAWGFIHVMYLVSFKNRITVLIQWLFSYFTGLKGARLINRCLEEELDPKKGKYSPE